MGPRTVARIQRQSLEYVVVCLVSNLTVCLVYLLLTATIVGPKIAMTSYAATHAFGYSVNLSALSVLVDDLRFRHEIVQGCMVVTVAVVLFLLQKYWVFPTGLAQRASHINKVSLGESRP